jgi:hypothetical protein
MYKDRPEMIKSSLTFDCDYKGSFSNMCSEFHGSLKSLTVTKDRIEMVYPTSIDKVSKLIDYVLVVRRANIHFLILVHLEILKDEEQIFFGVMSNNYKEVSFSHVQNFGSIKDMVSSINSFTTYHVKLTTPTLFTDILQRKKNVKNILNNCIKKHCISSSAGMESTKFSLPNISKLILTYMPILEIGRKLSGHDVENLEKIIFSMCSDLHT